MTNRNRAVLFRYMMYKLGCTPLMVSNKAANQWIIGRWAFDNILNMQSDIKVIGCPYWMFPPGTQPWPQHAKH